MFDWNGKWSVREVPLRDPPPILPIRKSDDLRMSKSLFDGHSLPVAHTASASVIGCTYVIRAPLL
jgi:hypothetical protein